MRNNWRQAAVTYQIYPPISTNADGNCVGDLADPSSETLADFDFMVEQARAPGLKATIAQVLKHSSDQRQ
jgi:hypothetical protein